MPPQDPNFADEAVEFWEEDDIDIPATGNPVPVDPFEEDEDTQPDGEGVVAGGARAAAGSPALSESLKSGDNGVDAPAADNGGGDPVSADNPFRGISSFLSAQFGDDLPEPDEAAATPVPEAAPPADPPPETVSTEVDVAAPGNAGQTDVAPEGVQNSSGGTPSPVADTPVAAADPPRPDFSIPAADMPGEFPYSEPQLGHLERDPAGEGGAEVPAEPFFPIPDEVPAIPHEDTAETGPTGRRKRRARKRRGPVRVLANLVLWLFLVLVLGAIGAGLMYYRYASARLMGTQPGPERSVIVTVNPGDRFSQIVQSLRREKLIGSYMGIDDRYLMKFLAWTNGNSNQIKSGVYRLNATMGLSALYDKLIQGSQDFRVTIPEGKTARQIAATIRRQIDSFDEERFIELTKDTQFISQLGLDLPSLEGYLFPSTYFFGPGMKEEDLIKTMVKTFIDKSKQRLQGVTKKDDLSFQQHVIIASLIEREARIDADRPLIASVIFNRLRKDMSLEIDATVCYAINDWSRKLTTADTKVESPYNTYLIKGLPPGPICNPGMASLAASFEYPKTDYLFYVYKGDGSHAFANTYEEHLANRRLYQRGGVASAGTPQSRKGSSPSETPAPAPKEMPPASVGSDVTTSTAAKVPKQTSLRDAVGLGKYRAVAG